MTEINRKIKIIDRDKYLFCLFIGFAIVVAMFISERFLQTYKVDIRETKTDDEDFEMVSPTREYEETKKTNQIKHGISKLKELSSGKCQSITPSFYEPDSASNMVDWSFVRKQDCQQPLIDPLLQKRSNFSLNCKSLPTKLKPAADNKIFTVEFRDKCLQSFIEKCCVDEYPVPNVVHYVWYGEKQLEYFNFLSLMSVLRFHKPCIILIHGPTLPHGPYWDYFLNTSANIVHVYRERPEEVFGNKLKFREHSSDVMRIEALIEYGGIYLDFDEVLLRPIDSLRRFQYTQGHETVNKIGSQLILASKNATFLKLWYQSYRDNYKPSWTYNALNVPNTLSKQHPELIHVEGFNFTRPNWQNKKQIFDKNYNWATNYGMHMFARAYKRPVDTNIIRTLNTTVGSVSRHILFGNKELCFS